MAGKQETLFYRQQIEEVLQHLRQGVCTYILMTYRKNGTDSVTKINQTLMGTAGFQPLSVGAADSDIVKHLDTQKLLKLMSRDWDASFKPAGLGDLERGYVYELAGYRNLWAHEKSLSIEDFHRVADTVHRFLVQIDASIEATSVQKIVEESRKKQRAARGTPIIIEIVGSRFNETSVERIYQMVLVYLAQRKYLEKIEFPYATSKDRYLLAREPIHPNGTGFLAPVEFQGYYLEAHNNRPQALTHLKKLVEKCGLDLIIIQS